MPPRKPTTKPTAKKKRSQRSTLKRSASANKLIAFTMKMGMNPALRDNFERDDTEAKRAGLSDKDIATLRSGDSRKLGKHLKMMGFLVDSEFEPI